jgi:hypothetical protein
MDRQWFEGRGEQAREKVRVSRGLQKAWLS